MWVFAGQDDGHVRLFFKAADEPWLELVQFGPLSLTSSIRILRVLELRDDPSLLLLAFGATDGTIGVAAMELPHNPADWAGAGLQRDPPVLLVHTREGTEISGLVFYQDGSDSGAEGEIDANGRDDAAADVSAWRLMALTRAGVVSIHDVDLFNNRSDRGHRDSLLPPPPGVPRRRMIAGCRLDHFNLGHDCRALALVRPSDPSKDPQIAVGGSAGQVQLCELAAPKATRRRRILALRCAKEADDFKDPVLRRVIGRDLLPHWLRLAQVGSLHLVRYSLWIELRRETSKVRAAVENTVDLEKTINGYIGTVDELADEVFRRQPFSKEPVKIIWEEGAKVANFIAQHALVREQTAPQLLPLFTELGDRLSQLCNQWVGYEQRLESRVLIHSFNALMDWPSIVLLSLKRTGEGKEDPHAQARRFIVDELIHRRLFFDDLLVPLEALNAINTALIRSIDLRGQGLPCCQRSVLDLSFFELIALVGTLAERRETQLGTHHPLRTEITRFFALSLLWIPDGVFALAATISECGLTERRRDIGRLVLRQAHQFFDQLKTEFGWTANSGEIERLDRYDKYLAGANLEPTLGPHVEDDWRSDRRVLPEADSVRRGADALREVLQPSREREAVLDEVLRERDPQRDCLAHSRACLRELRQYRDTLKQLLQAARDTFEVAAVVERYKDATDLCDKAEVYVSTPGVVFEPQRSQYLEIVESWRKRIQGEQEHPIRILDLFDRFNRHVYQATADDLMASLQELALRTAPLTFWSPDPAPHYRATSLRWLIRAELGPHPVLSDVFDRAVRLVENAHLSGTLLAVAKAMASGAARRLHHTASHVRVEQIRERLEQLCLSNGLDLTFLPGNVQRIPGGMDVWDAILQEWTRNVRKYGTDEQNPSRRFDAVIELRGPTHTLSMWGDRSFRKSLPTRLQGREGELIEQLKRDVGTRFAESAEPGGGFGLPLVLWLCDFIGLQADLSLGPDSDPEHPLMLTISWERSRP